MSAENKDDAGVSPMEAQNTAQRHAGPTEPQPARAQGGTTAASGAAETPQAPGDTPIRERPVRKGGDGEARDDR